MTGTPVETAGGATARQPHLVWWLSTAQLVSWGSLYYSFSLFLEPMREELGWSGQQISGAFSLGLLIAALGAIPIGRAIDRGHARAVMTGGSVVAAVLLATWSQIDRLSTFYAIWAAFGLVLSAVLYEPAFAVLVRHYPRKQRRAITHMTLIGGFASTLFVPLTYWLITQFGWRDALLVLALGNVLVGAAIHGLLLPSARTQHTPVTKPVPAQPSGLATAKRSTVFASLALSFAGSAFVFSAVSAHLVPLLQAQGRGAALAMAAVVLVGPAQVLARAVLLTVEQRTSTRVLGIVSTALLPLSLLLLVLAETAPWLLYAFALLYGASNGLTTLVRGGVVLEYFGRDRYGALSGALALPATLAKAVAPAMTSLFWNPDEGYADAVWLLVVAAFLSALAFWSARPTNDFPLTEQETHR